MTAAVSQVSLPLKAPSGQALAFLSIAAPVTRGRESPLLVLDSTEAERWHEYTIQLLEGISYDFELKLSVPGARLREGIVRRSPLSTAELERGRIEPGSHTGILPLILDDASGRPIAAGAVEVRSSKLDYRLHYRRMLEDLAKQLMDLLVDIKSPTGTWLRADGNESSTSVLQRFFLVKHLVTQTTLREAIAQISAKPHEGTCRVAIQRPSGKSIRSSGKLGRQFAAGGSHRAIPSSHALATRFHSLPRFLKSPEADPTLDTPENRFVLFVLRSFESFVSYVEQILSQEGRVEYRQVLSETSEVLAELERLRSRLPFKDIGRGLQTLPLASIKLQRLSGYRDILNAWVQFHLLARLTWKGGDDIFLSGKRDVALLYEYWAFFQLFDVLKQMFVLDNIPDALVVVDTEGLTLRLKSGRALSITGNWDRDGQHFRVRYSYNRTFGRRPIPPGDPERSCPNSGSWTRSMRPDYTISFWPARCTEIEAEAAGKIVHLHFDAKYRVDKLPDLFGDDYGSADDLPANRGAARRDDLLKMHAYKDAIRGSASAFVIYPGSENRKWRASTDVVPAIGAIALRPGDPGGATALRSFIEDALGVLTTTLAD